MISQLQLWLYVKLNTKYNLINTSLLIALLVIFSEFVSWVEGEGKDSVVVSLPPYCGPGLTTSRLCNPHSKDFFQNSNLTWNSRTK